MSGCGACFCQLLSSMRVQVALISPDDDKVAYGERLLHTACLSAVLCAETVSASPQSSSLGASWWTTSQWTHMQRSSSRPFWRIGCVLTWMLSV